MLGLKLIYHNKWGPGIFRFLHHKDKNKVTDMTMQMAYNIEVN